jgi:hypothetical protein
MFNHLENKSSTSNTLDVIRLIIFQSISGAEGYFFNKRKNLQG